MEVGSPPKTGHDLVGDLMQRQMIQTDWLWEEWCSRVRPSFIDRKKEKAKEVNG